MGFNNKRRVAHSSCSVRQLYELVRHIHSYCKIAICLRPNRTITLETNCLIYRMLRVIRGNKVGATVLSTSTTYRVPSILRVPCEPPLGDSALPRRDRGRCQLSDFAYLTKSVVKSCNFTLPLGVNSELCFRSVTVCSVIGGGAFGNVPLPSVCDVSKRKGYHLVGGFKCSSFGNELS